MKAFPHHWLNLLALALCLVVSAGCTKASKAKRLLAAADRDYKARKYDAAEIEYQTVLSLSPLNPVAVRRLGCIYSEEGRALQASVFLRKANEQDPQNPEVQLRLAEIYGSNRGTNEAVKLLGSVLQAEPTNEEAMLLLVQVTASKDLSSARQRMETQLREGGQASAACHSALGFIDLRMDKTNDAQIEFQKAVALDPKLASPYQGMAALCFMRKDIKVRRAVKIRGFSNANRGRGGRQKHPARYDAPGAGLHPGLALPDENVLRGTQIRRMQGSH
jgi:predicted Zn-dependent protease